MTATLGATSRSSIREAPDPQFVMAFDAVRIATYDVGEEGAPAVLAVHGFASSATVNWFDTGWVRELVRAGYRVVALDQRGHGRSDKPHDASAYSMQQLVADVVTVLDAYPLDEVALAATPSAPGSAGTPPSTTSPGS